MLARSSGETTSVLKVQKWHFVVTCKRIVSKKPSSSNFSWASCTQIKRWINLSAVVISDTSNISIHKSRLNFPGAAALKIITCDNKILKHWDSSYLLLVLQPCRLYLIHWYSYFIEVHEEFELCPPPQRLNASFFPAWIQPIFRNPINPGALESRKAPNIDGIVQRVEKKICSFADPKLRESKRRNWIW